MEQSNAFSVQVGEGHVKVTGEIDVTTTPIMVEAVMRAMTVELDLSEVTFIDSSGLSGLINLRNSRGALQIVAVSPPVHRLLECTCLTESLLTHNRATGSTR
ncbi:MAG: STAS domain-containing protein [Acidimicrobiales bacterium]